MLTRAAIMRSAPGSWKVVELELADPRRDELQIRLAASGLCHSDDRVATGLTPVAIYPMAGGHEGAGIVTAVGPGTAGFQVGDHVVLKALPGCGHCRWCAEGTQVLCDMGAYVHAGSRPDEPGTYRMSWNGDPVGQMSGISTFSEYTTVSTAAAVKIADDIPLTSACLVGCGVGTGWGAAVNSADVRAGQTVIVMGIGGVGINAVQGASHAGASHVLAVDPAPLKREKALEFGATHAFDTMEDAIAEAKSLTNGQGADATIVTVAVTRPEHVAQAFASVRKGGTVVVVGLGDVTEVGLPIRLAELTLWQKRLQGSIFGGGSPDRDIPLQLRLYREGRLKLDELVTRTYSLDEINQGYEDLHCGRNLRGVIVFD